MVDCYLGEIRMFAGHYVPVGWAACNGQLLSVSANQPLFALLGTTWGGDGVNTFGVPNLQGRVPIGQGQGTNLTNRQLAQTLGTETVALTSAQTPSHTHTLNASAGPATTPSLTAPTSAATLCTLPATDGSLYYNVPSAGVTVSVVTLPTDTLSPFQGGGQAHHNLMPGMGTQYMIATQGIFPTRA